MGSVIQPTAQMGEYKANLRSESFSIIGESDFDHIHNGGPAPRHGIFVYPRVMPEAQAKGIDTTVISRYGDVEILIEDIPKLRALLNAVEAQLAEEDRLDEIYAPKERV